MVFAESKVCEAQYAMAQLSRKSFKREGPRYWQEFLRHFIWGIFGESSEIRVFFPPKSNRALVKSWEIPQRVYDLPRCFYAIYIAEKGKLQSSWTND
jgi:hypothetical protein